MKLNKLLIALAVAAPAVFIVACGSHETRDMADQVIQPIPEIDSEQQALPLEQQPAEDIVDAVYAELETADAMAEETPAPVTEQVETIQQSPTPEQPEQSVFYFATGDSSVKQDDFDTIINHAQFLMQNPDQVIRLSGHTDQSGSVEYNRWLSGERAKAVARVLIEYGVNPKQIQTESAGADKPVLGLTHAIADRRVELEYVEDTQLSEISSF